jgi:hypothetical protein
LDERDEPGVLETEFVPGNSEKERIFASSSRLQVIVSVMFRHFFIKALRHFVDVVSWSVFALI